METKVQKTTNIVVIDDAILKDGHSMIKVGNVLLNEEALDAIRYIQERNEIDHPERAKMYIETLSLFMDLVSHPEPYENVLSKLSELDIEGVQVAIVSMKNDFRSFAIDNNGSKFRIYS